MGWLQNTKYTSKSFQFEMQDSRAVLNIMHPELINKICSKAKVNSKAIPVTAFGGP
jgi:hypothetical protein